MLAGHLTDLGGLGIHNLGELLDLSVDEGLVRSVDQGAEEENRSTDESEAPEGDDLNEVVGDESREEGRARGQDVLSEQKALRLNNEEVDQLIQIPSHRIQRSLGNGIILPRPYLRRETRIEQRAPRHLRGDGDTKRHPRQLESIAKQIQIARCEDEHHGSGVREGRRAGVLPAEKGAEEGVVVREGLAGGGARGGGLARGGERGELGGGLGCFGFDVFSDGTWGGWRVSYDLIVCFL